MSECTRFAPMLTARPGELPAGEAQALEQHLDGCVECRALRATFQATEGLLAEGLLAQANARDFAPFTDAVMARVERRDHATGRLFDWISHHRVRAAVSALVPALAAAALVVYFQAFRHDVGPMPAPHLFELSSEGSVTTVLRTESGPIVLMNDHGDHGT